MRKKRPNHPWVKYNYTGMANRGFEEIHGLGKSGETVRESAADVLSRQICDVLDAIKRDRAKRAGEYLKEL
jgi:hypothetical protein